jgi:hypothetical protein
MVLSYLTIEGVGEEGNMPIPLTDTFFANTVD